MKKTLSVILCIMAIIALSSCYNYYIPWPIPGTDDQAPADEPYAPAENADKKLSGDITVDQVTAAFKEEGVDSVAFEGTITVGDAETLNIPAGKSLIGVDPEKSIIQGKYDGGAESSGNMSLIEVRGVLDNVTAQLDPTESFSNWDDPAQFAKGKRTQVVSICGGTLQNSVVKNGRNGVYSHSNMAGTTSKIVNNEIYHNRTGIQYQHNAATSAVNLTITGNHVYENETLGILLQAPDTAGTSGTIIVRDNTIQDNWYSNVEIRRKAEADFSVNDDLATANIFDSNPATTSETKSTEHGGTVRYNDYFNGGLAKPDTVKFNADIVDVITT